MKKQTEKGLFSSTLQQLGYGVIEESTGKSIPSDEWLFEKDETKSLLLWLSNTLRPSNVLLAEDVKRYNELVSKGQTLQGEELEQALETMKTVNFEQDVDSLKSDINRLSQEVANSNARLSALVSQRDRIATLHASLSHRNAALDNHLEKMKVSEADIRQSFGTSVNEMRDALKQLDHSINDVIDTHTLKSAAVGPASFLTHLPLKPYLEDEKLFLRLVRSLIENFDNLENENDVLSQYEFLGVRSDDLPSGLLEVETEDTNAIYARELMRICNHYEKSLRLELEAKVREAKLRAEEQALREEQSIPAMSPDDVMRQLAATKEAILKSQQVLHAHMSHTVPSLVHDRAQTALLPVLVSDLEENIARLELSVSNGDHVMSYILDQRSRLDLLKAALLREEAHHTHSLTLVQGALSEASRIIDPLPDRVKILQSKLSVPPPRTVDSKDPSFVRLHSVVENFKPKSHVQFLTPEVLISAAKALFKERAASVDTTKDLLREREDLLSRLWLNVNSLNGILFGNSDSGLPMLTDPELVATNEKLEKLLKIFEGMVSDIIKFQRSHQEETNYWSEERKKERELFIHFFTNPERLVQMHKDLVARVEARNINPNPTQ